MCTSTTDIAEEVLIMTNIQAILANVPVPNLDAAIPFYQRVTGTEDVHRFSFGDLQVARVGPFLLTQGVLTGWSAEQRVTIVVTSIDEMKTAVDAGGADVLDGPHQVPNGARMVVRHPDGAVIEYLQPGPATA